MNTTRSTLAYLTKSLAIFNKINLICKTAGQEHSSSTTNCSSARLSSNISKFAIKYLSGRRFRWSEVGVSVGQVGWLVGRPTVGRRVVAARLLQIIYLHLSPPSSDSTPPPPCSLLLQQSSSDRQHYSLSPANCISICLSNRWQSAE